MVRAASAGARISASLRIGQHHLEAIAVEAFVQYNSLTDQVSTNARLRYNFREGQDLWFVWNEGLNLERDVLGKPRLPFSDARTLTLKYTHTLIF